MRKIFCFLMLCLPVTAWAQNLPDHLILDGVYFDLDRAIIRTDSYPYLDGQAELLKKERVSRFRIVGHTDNQGSDDYNLRLSDDRARAVKEYFMSRGVDPRRLEAQGKGESEPREPNNTERGRALNRRIELIRLR